MNRIPVHASNIRSVGYDPEMRKFEVEFHSGGIYQYVGEPENIDQGFMRSASKEPYFHDHIKDRYPNKHVR